MGKRASVYLGGRISGLTYEDAISPRKEAASYLTRLGLIPVDPMEKEGGLASIGKPIDDVLAAESMGMDFESIISKDEKDIFGSDYYLLLTGSSPSWGSGIEMGLALYTARIPVVSVGNTDPASGWLARKSLYAAEDIRDACLFIASHAYKTPVPFLELYLECGGNASGLSSYLRNAGWQTVQHQA